MKKVKISLKPNSSGKKIYLFPNAESLYVWSCAIEQGETLQVPDIEELVLEPECFIEAELMGFEYAFEENQKFRRLELVRFGKTQKPKNSSGILVTIHSGWVLGSLMPMKSYEDSDMVVRPLLSSESRLDLPSLFKDDYSVNDIEKTIDLEIDEEKDKK